jgi:hypothetical protein
MPNMQVIKKSRPKLRPGDIFSILFSDGGYLYGRVIKVNLAGSLAPMPGCNLIYIYRVRGDDINPPLDELTPARLLVPPRFINRLPWVRGYFVNVAHVAIADGDIVDDYCFYDWARRIYVDENYAILSKRSEPCGYWGMDSYLTIDDSLSDALNIARAIDD